MLFNHKRADFWLPNFGFKRSLLRILKRNFSVAVLLSLMKDHLIPRRMQFTAYQYLFSFQRFIDGQISIIFGTKCLRVQQKL